MWHFQSNLCFPQNNIKAVCKRNLKLNILSDIRNANFQKRFNSIVFVHLVLHYRQSDISKGSLSLSIMKGEASTEEIPKGQNPLKQKISRSRGKSTLNTVVRRRFSWPVPRPENKITQRNSGLTKVGSTSRRSYAHAPNAVGTENEVFIGEKHEFRVVPFALWEKRREWPKNKKCLLFVKFEVHCSCCCWWWWNTTPQEEWCWGFFWSSSHLGLGAIIHRASVWA